jgi:small GTP-binding protein
MSKKKEKIDKINIITLGNSSVGKTSFIQRYVDDIFEDTLATIGFNAKFKTKILSNGEKLKVYFYDTSGQEKYNSLSYNYIKNSHGIILMYDISKKESFTKIKDWLKNILEHKDKDFPILLLGNKCDLEEEREVTKEEGNQLANELNLHFYETSNKNNINIEKAITELIEMIYKKLEKEFPGFETEQVKLDKSKNIKKRKKC